MPQFVAAISVIVVVCSFVGCTGVVEETSEVTSASTSVTSGACVVPTSNGTTAGLYVTYVDGANATHCATATVPSCTTVGYCVNTDLASIQAVLPSTYTIQSVKYAGPIPYYPNQLTYPATTGGTTTTGSSTNISGLFDLIAPTYQTPKYNLGKITAVTLTPPPPVGKPPFPKSVSFVCFRAQGGSCFGGTNNETQIPYPLAGQTITATVQPSSGGQSCTVSTDNPAVVVTQPNTVGSFTFQNNATTPTGFTLSATCTFTDSSRVTATNLIVVNPLSVVATSSNASSLQSAFLSVANHANFAVGWTTTALPTGTTCTLWRATSEGSYKYATALTGGATGSFFETAVNQNEPYLDSHDFYLQCTTPGQVLYSTGEVDVAIQQ